MTNLKPQAISQIAIVEIHPTDRIVRFDATPDLIERLRSDELGSLTADESGAPSYTLRVSALYDFMQVVDYLKRMAA